MWPRWWRATDPGAAGRRGPPCYDRPMVVTVLAIGDIIGRPGREAVAKVLPQLRREFAIDLVVANGENAAGGFGLTPKIADDLFSLGIDVLTSGNHIWDQREMMTGFDDHRPILRPHNYPSGAPGRGWFCHDLGMVGPRDSVIGMDKEASLQRFLTGVPYRFKVAEGPVQFNSVLVRIDALSGKADAIERLDREVEIG